MVKLGGGGGMGAQGLIHDQLKLYLLFTASAKILELERCISLSNLYGSDVDQGICRGGQSKINHRGFESSPSDLLRAKWRNSVRLECL